MFHVILVEPQIPPNTGSIIRLCANTGTQLHLVKPLGFELDRRSVRRAGLDYHAIAQVAVHDSFDACCRALAAPRLFIVETGMARRYTEPAFESGDAFVFGAEDRGLHAELVAAIPEERRLFIPMRAGNRSLNLANAAAVILYEAWRQRGFSGHGS